MSKGKKLKNLAIKVMMIIGFVVLITLGIFVVTYNNSLYAKQTASSTIKVNNPLNKTLAVFGVDEDGKRTDVIFVLNYNSIADKLSIISIPRDTRVEWTQEQQSLIKELKGYTIRTSKLNEMTSYGDLEHIRDLTINQIETLLDIQVDNYMIITLDAFRQIVDAVGGVDVDVPNITGNGLHYDDNYQGLHIHLEPGMQHLDGAAAEGLVRYRKGYAEGDVGRIKTQQIFLESFMDKVLRPSIIFKIPNILSVLKNTVTTDIKWSEVTSYLPYLTSLDKDSLECHIVPGEGKYVGNVSYYIIDKDAVPSFMESVTGDTVKTLDGTNAKKVVIDQGVSIQVLNSTDVAGLARKSKDLLEGKGYCVDAIGDYTLDTLNKTLIYAHNTELGQQFLEYYPEARVREDKNIPYDICIVLGKDTLW